MYFDVTTFPRFGEVSHFDPATMLAMAAEHGGNPDDPNKRHPLDFVLWQPSLPDEPAWESRWGPGRPGWHIECSALVLRELGETIDVHGGGRDLVFPHHECETAQSEAATGVPFVRHWLHVGLVGLDGHEDVEVARQPGLRGRPPEGVGAGGGPARPAVPPLPPRLGVVERRPHPGARPGWRPGGPSSDRPRPDDPGRRRQRRRDAGLRRGRPVAGPRLRSTTTSTRRRRWRPSTRRPPPAVPWSRGPHCWALPCSPATAVRRPPCRCDPHATPTARRPTGPSERHSHGSRDGPTPRWQHQGVRARHDGAGVRPVDRVPSGQGGGGRHLRRGAGRPVPRPA